MSNLLFKELKHLDMNSDMNEIGVIILLELVKVVVVKSFLNIEQMDKLEKY